MDERSIPFKAEILSVTARIMASGSTKSFADEPLKQRYFVEDIYMARLITARCLVIYPEEFIMMIMVWWAYYEHCLLQS